jgi:hypothetical protein
MLRNRIRAYRRQTAATPSGIINQGTQWIQHGDNVITLATAQSGTDYKAEVSIQLPSMGGVTTRGPWHNTNPMVPTVKVDTTTRLLVRLHGGFGFTSCGDTAVGGILGTTERFDDIANSQTARTAATARTDLAGYSLNGFGFTSCGRLVVAGVPVNTTERFDDVVNAHTARVGPVSARVTLAEYSLNGYGFTSCGDTDNSSNTAVGTTERFDDVTNAWTGRLAATGMVLIILGSQIVGDNLETL